VGLRGEEYARLRERDDRSRPGDETEVAAGNTRGISRCRIARMSSYAPRGEGVLASMNRHVSSGRALYGTRSISGSCCARILHYCRVSDIVLSIEQPYHSLPCVSLLCLLIRGYSTDAFNARVRTKSPDRSRHFTRFHFIPTLRIYLRVFPSIERR